MGAPSPARGGGRSTGPARGRRREAASEAAGRQGRSVVRDSDEANVAATDSGVQSTAGNFEHLH